MSQINGNTNHPQGPWIDKYFHKGDTKFTDLGPVMKKENILHSWKEISVYLDRDSRTCHRWESELGMPVYHYHGNSVCHCYGISIYHFHYLKKEGGDVCLAGSPLPTETLTNVPLVGLVVFCQAKFLKKIV